MGVPSAAAQRAVAAHGLVAQDDVLERAREHVVDAGTAVRGRRPLVEDEERSVRAYAVDLVEQVRLPPRFEDRRLQLREVHLAGDGFVPFRIACHAAPSVTENARPHTGGRTLPWYHHHSPAPGAGALRTSRRARMRAEGCRCNGRAARPRLLAPGSGAFGRRLGRDVRQVARAGSHRTRLALRAVACVLVSVAACGSIVAGEARRRQTDVRRTDRGALLHVLLVDASRARP